MRSILNIAIAIMLMIVLFSVAALLPAEELLGKSANGTDNNASSASGRTDNINVSITYALVAILLALLQSLTASPPLRWGLYFVWALLLVLLPLFWLTLPLLPIAMFDLDAKNSRRFAILLPLAAVVIMPAWAMMALTVLLMGVVVLLEWDALRLSGLERDVLGTRDQLTNEFRALQLKHKELLANAGEQDRQVRMDERMRIARDLHDVVGHHLSGALLQLEAVRVLNRDETLKPLIADLDMTLDSGMTRIREALHDLHDEGFDLEAKIKASLERLPNVRTRVNVRLDAPLPENVKLDIWALVQEGITNFARHSNGDALTITVLDQPAFYSVRIADNGTPPPGRRIVEGLGLSGMREICARHLGHLTIQTERGFAVQAVLLKGEKS